MKSLYLICLLFIISACGTPTTEDRITFTQVDPFLKVFRESNFFPEYDETEEVAAGEHATFQFAVRAALPLKECRHRLRRSPTKKEHSYKVPRVRVL